MNLLLIALHLCCWSVLMAKELYVKYERGFLYKYKLFQYEDEDLATSITLGRKCESFIIKETQTFGVDGEDESETKPHAINICEQVAALLQLPFDPEAYYVDKHKKAWADALPILDFMKKGWIVAEDIVPELRDEAMVQTVLLTLKKKKFEHVIKALLAAKERWNISQEGARELCGLFDEGVLSDENMADDEGAEYLYRAGVQYVKCVGKYFSSMDNSTYNYTPFDQALNIHRVNSAVYDLATSEGLGGSAASLLRHNVVRLYQTALLWKDSSSEQSELRRDLSSMPLDAREGGSLTLWCPLVRTLRHDSDSMLRFVPGSHRDMSQAHWYTAEHEETVEVVQARQLRVGDCTVHHGWIRHFSPPQKKGVSLAVSFTYVIGDATVLDDFPAVSPLRYTTFEEEENCSYRDWIADLHGGDVIDHPLLPIVFDARIIAPLKNVFIAK